MVGVLLGVLFLGVLQNGLTLLNVTDFWQQVANGAALIVAAGLSVLSTKASTAMSGPRKKPAAGERPMRAAGPATAETPAVASAGGPATHG
jgi:ribose transport system permease protein